MPTTSRPGIFSKRNLVYIPLSITIAHTLNFIVNSPLSTWHKFPPKLPDSVYSSIFFIPLLLFISLSFEPIQTKKRFYTLLSLALIFISIPLNYRSGKYSIFQTTLMMIAMQYGLKMILFLKFNRAYLNQNKSDQKREFKPYLWTSFNWRFNSYIIPPKSKDSNEKENSLIIKSPTTSQINKKLISRFIIIIAKWLICELAFFITFIKYSMEIPEKAYQIRLIEFITKGTLPVTLPLMLRHLNFVGLIYICCSIEYDIFTILFTTYLRIFYPAEDDRKPILVRLGLLTPSEYVCFNEWVITFVFNTKHVFCEPWMSSSPRDLWSVRWQLMFNEIFKELGYLPARNFFASFAPKKVANMMGVIGAFCVSALLHEYLIIGQYDVWTGEHFFFFMSHGVVLILWEAVFGYESKNENVKVKRFLKWFLFMIINLILLPAFAEPMKIDCSKGLSYFNKCHEGVII